MKTVRKRNAALGALFLTLTLPVLLAATLVIIIEASVNGLRRLYRRVEGE